MPFEIQVHFKKNRSRYYPQAVELAGQISKFSQGDPNVATIDEKSLRKNLRRVYQLCHITKNWRDTRLYLNGSKTQWEYIRRQIIGLDCYYGYETEIIQGIWCWESKKRQGWGCKQLSEIKTHYNPHEYRDFVYWFDFGHFITDNIWQINKKELLKILKREAELKRLDLCPLFDFNNITKTVKNLPDQIDLSVDSNWEKIDINEFDGESKTISIRPTSDSCGWS